MRTGGPSPAAGHRAGTHQEGSLNQVTFVGSFPTAAFRLDPALPEVAFLGRSNVGKSSLLNAIVGRKAIARTSKTPGKTRDCNVYRVDDRFYLIDLPGYGYARVSKVERRRFSTLIDRVLTTRDRLLGAVWLLDIRHPPSDADERLADRLREAAVPLLVAVTKADKVGRGRRPSHLRAIMTPLQLDTDQVVTTSARTKEGITDLRDSIVGLVEDDGSR